MGSVSLPEDKPWVEQVPREELLAAFEGWGPDVCRLLACMPEKTLKWSVPVVHPPLEAYAKGHVAILGDAVRAYKLSTIG